MSNPYYMNKKKIKVGKGLLEHTPNLCNYSTSLTEEELKSIIKASWEKVKESHKGREWVIYPPLENRIHT